ncbi:hypothetical protein DFJ73DRAFT_856293 [Zopfochytrium polystomum]|nr:hypothetical protein DFJ73DRAFT_856293 [Zopfochytrium polystomum]
MPLVTSVAVVAERLFRKAIDPKRSDSAAPYPSKSTPPTVSASASSVAIVQSPASSPARQLPGLLCKDSPKRSSSPSLLSSPLPPVNIELALRNTLVALVNKLSLPVFNIEPPILNAPIEYYHIADTPYYTMGLLVLKSGQTLPIHDHPGHDLIHGDLHVKSYEFVESSRPLPSPGRVARISKNRIVSANSGDSLLTIFPDHGPNLHSFTAASDYVVVLDLLGPPYNEVDRPCTYFDIPEAFDNSDRMEGVSWAEVEREQSDKPARRRNRNARRRRRRRGSAGPATVSPDADVGDSDGDGLESCESPASTSVNGLNGGHSGSEKRGFFATQNPSPPVSDVDASMSGRSPTSWEPPSLPRDTFHACSNQCQARSPNCEGATVFLPFFSVTPSSTAASQPDANHQHEEAFEAIHRVYRGARVNEGDADKARGASDEALLKLGRGVLSVWDGLVESMKARTASPLVHD